jgi:hypothetical protein
MSVVPSIGRIVHYILSDEDADAINRRRADFGAFQRGRNPALLDASSHIAQQSPKC